MSPRSGTYDPLAHYEFQIWISANREAGHLRAWNHLSKTCQPAPSLRTVARWLAEFRARDEDEKENDAPWTSWPEMPTGLPDDAGPFLLRLISAMQCLELFSPDHFPYFYESVEIEGQRIRVEGAPWPVPPLTTRDARWAWLVHTSAPDLDLHDTFWISQIAVIRSRTAGVMRPVQAAARPPDYSDIATFLGSEPWKGEDEFGRYQAAVTAGRLPKIEPEHERFVKSLDALQMKWRVPGKTKAESVRIAPPLWYYHLSAHLVQFHNAHLIELREQGLL